MCVHDVQVRYLANIWIHMVAIADLICFDIPLHPRQHFGNWLNNRQHGHLGVIAHSLFNVLYSRPTLTVKPMSLIPGHSTPSYSPRAHVFMRKYFNDGSKLIYLGGVSNETYLLIMSMHGKRTAMIQLLPLPTCTDDQIVIDDVSLDTIIRP
jgi:hypothetical protein